jgi:hypothetical protein
MPAPESRRTALLKLKMDMVYRGLTTAKAEERFNQNVSPPVPATEGAPVGSTLPPTQ